MSFDNDNDVPKSHQTLPAQNPLQPSWAHSAFTDSTLILIHSPHEYIGIRHRATQQLSLSDLIHYQNPGYETIHVGLHIAAVNDALDRALQVLPVPPHVSELAPPTAHHHQNHHHPVILPPLIPSETKNYNIVLYIHYGICNSATPSTFIRSRINPPFPSSSPHEHITLTLTSPIASGATGIIHTTTFHVESTRANVVVKLSWQKDRLHNEYTIYETLASHDTKGIPTVLGIFDDIDSEGPSMLIMTHAGSPLPHHALSSSQRLKDIHNANILHCARTAS